MYSKLFRCLNIKGKYSIVTWILIQYFQPCIKIYNCIKYQRTFSLHVRKRASHKEVQKSAAPFLISHTSYTFCIFREAWILFPAVYSNFVKTDYCIYSKYLDT